jgi:molybdate transport system substrate-binding protein
MPLRPLLPLLAAVVAGCSPAAPAPTSTVRVAVAASMKPAFEDVAAAFRERHPGVTVTATYGASGTFAAQITNGAPFDVFLSADTDYPRRLAEQGAAAPDDVFRYATGKLVVWVPATSPVRFDADGLKALAAADVRTVAVPNPRHAPYGRAAEAALRKAGVWDAVSAKIVTGENAEQTAQMLHSGAADAGFLPLSLARSPKLAEGRMWDVPEDLYPPIEQAGVVLKPAADPAAANELRAFLTGPAGRAILARHGFDPPRE